MSTFRFVTTHSQIGNGKLPELESLVNFRFAVLDKFHHLCHSFSPHTRFFLLRIAYSIAIRLFQYLIAITVSWLVCFMLTITGLEPVGGEARTDKNHTLVVLSQSPWFQIPYPGIYLFFDHHISIRQNGEIMSKIVKITEAKRSSIVAYQILILIFF